MVSFGEGQVSIIHKFKGQLEKESQAQKVFKNIPAVKVSYVKKTVLHLNEGSDTYVYSDRRLPLHRNSGYPSKQYFNKRIDYSR